MYPDTQSPWFWFLLFGGMALLGVAVIGPKHAEREQRRLRMQAAREIGQSGDLATAHETDEADLIEQTPPSVQPLMAFLAALLLAGAAWAQWRARRATSAAMPPGESSP